ncbi:unnamed protein product, partial [Polarella glacialis]
MATDWWAQWIMCIPCALILSCLVFKANCEEGYYCVKGSTTVWACTAAFWLHIVLHTLFLKYVVPRFRLEGESDGADSNTYKGCSERIAASWVTMNPIYVLRSQYFYKRSPACEYCLPGKEHRLETNEEIGLFFNDCAAAAEDYNAPHVDTDALNGHWENLHSQVSGRRKAEEAGGRRGRGRGRAGAEVRL